KPLPDRRERRRMQEARAEMLEFAEIELGRGGVVVVEGEGAGEIIETQLRLDAVGGAEMGEIAVDRQGLDAVGAQLADRQAAGALREARAADVGEQRQVAELQRRRAEGLEQLRLRAGVGDMV